MAMSQFPMMKTGGGLLSKVVGWLVGLALLTMVVKHPAESAQGFTAAFGALSSVIDSLAAFFSNVAV